MSTLSAGLINVENLTVTGTQSGAIQATNLSFTNLDLSGNLTVGGSITGSNIKEIPFYNLSIGENCFGPNLNTDYASGNTNVGDLSYQNLTTGINNTNVGWSGMPNLTEGIANTAIGSGALSTVTAGSYNVALGYAGTSITTGYNNTCVGSNAGNNIAPSGENNIALGSGIYFNQGSFDVYDLNGNQLLDVFNRLVGGSITADASANVYINAYPGIIKYDPSGTEIAVYTLPDEYSSQALSLDASGNIYFVSTYTNELYKVDSSGNVTVDISGNDTYNYISYALFDQNGNVYVSYQGGGPGNFGCVIKYNSSRNVVYTIAVSGDGTVDSINSCAGMAFDPSGNLYITNPFNNSITIHNPTTSALITQHIYPTIQPAYIGVDASFNFYVLGYNSIIIGKYSSSGVLLDTFTNFASPLSMFLQNDKFYVINNSGGPVVSNTAIIGNSSITDTHLRGTIHIPGTLEQPQFVAMNQLQDNTVMDAQSVYTQAASDFGLTYLYPICEVQKTAPQGIFTDTTNTTVSEEFLTTYENTTPVSGKVYYYATDGTSEAPLDGTAGTPHYSGVYGNIGTPVFVDVSNNSSYSSALARVYTNAPAIIDQSGNSVGGAEYNLNYSSYANKEGFTPDGMVNSCQQVGRYYLKRGYSITAPAYIENDTSGNPYDVNFFWQYAGQYYTLPGYGIEFVYDPEGSSIVPVSINLVFVTLNYNPDYNNSTEPYQYLFSIGPQSLVDQLNSVRPLVNIPVTTDKSEYGSALIDGTNIVYYDLNKKILNINFVQPNTWTFTLDSSNFDFNQTVVHTMSSFTGSFAIVKKALATFITNGEVSNQFTSCAPNDIDAYLIQCSPTVNTVDETILNGTTLGVQTKSIQLTDTNTGNFQGLPLIRPGYGKIGTLTEVIYYLVTLNSYVSVDPSTATISTKHIDANPYSTMYEKMATSGNSSQWANSVFGKVIPTYNFDIFSTTPESTLLYDASFCVPTTNPDNIDTGVLIHENSHLRENSTGTIYLSGNTEGHATCIENDAVKYINGGEMSSAFRSWSANYMYTNNFAKGYSTLTHTCIAYENDLHSSSVLNLPNAGFLSQIPFSFRTQYAESIFYTYVKDHYDEPNQILRRTNEITIANSCQPLVENGFTTLSTAPLPNTTAPKFAYAQALWEVTSANGSGKEIADVFSDYTVHSLFLRNNSSIPDKYKSLYPYWLASEHNQFSAKLADYANQTYYPSYTIPTIRYWSDLDETNPILNENYGSGPGTEYANIDAEPLIPFWPRAGSGEEVYKPGSWARDGDGNLVDSSGNLIFDTNNYPATVIPGTGAPVWTPNTTPYATSDLVYLEDLTSRCYILPVSGVSGLGTNAFMDSITVTVARGNWDFAVVQFVPNGSNGTWTQLPSSGNYHNINNPGTWNDASGEVYNGIQTSYLDATSPVSYTFNLTGLSVQTYGGKKYYPKLVCVNKGLDTYGQYLNIYPPRARYSGKLTVTPFFD